MGERIYRALAWIMAALNMVAFGVAYFRGDFQQVTDFGQWVMIWAMAAYVIALVFRHE